MRVNPLVTGSTTADTVFLALVLLFELLCVLSFPLRFDYRPADCLLDLSPQSFNPASLDRLFLLFTVLMTRVVEFFQSFLPVLLDF